MYNNKGNIMIILGVLLNQLQRFEEANVIFDKAIEIDPL